MISDEKFTASKELMNQAYNYLRDGYEQALNALEEAETENAKLRELVRGLMYCADESCGMCARTPVGGEDPFTCCPLYDFDAKEYRCVELKRELGMEVKP